MKIVEYIGPLHADDVDAYRNNSWSLYGQRFGK